MPHKRKDSPYWWISYTNAGGQRTRESSGTEDYKEAVALESRKKYEAHQQQAWGTEPARTFDELLLGYLQETAARKKSHERDLYSAAPLTAYFTGKLLADITAQDINNYKRHRRDYGVRGHNGEKLRPLADGTIIKELRLLSSAINHARNEWGWKIDNVVTGRVPAKPPSRLRWLTRDEYNALHHQASQGRAKAYLPDFLDIAVNTGMRLKEIMALEWNRVDFGQRLVYLAPDNNKSGRHRAVPLNDTAVRALRNQWGRHPRWVFVRIIKKHQRAEPLGSIKKSFNHACATAGIQNVTRHTLRHTCAAWMVQAGVPLRTVADILGHTDISTTMIYAHLAPENARAGVSVLDDLQRDQIVTTAGKNAPNSANSC